MKTLKLLILIVIFSFGGLAAAKQVFVGQPATFKAKSTTGQERFEWSFPGGVHINGRVVSYTFSEAGTKTITLKVTNSLGQSNELTRTVVVYNVDKPTALIESKVNGKTYIDKIIKAKLSDTISLKSGAEQTSDHFIEEWKVNGRVYDQRQLPRVFNQIGTYQVNLEIYDPQKRSLKDIDSLQVLIENTEPVIHSITFAESKKIPGQIRVRVIVEDVDGELSNYKFEVLERGKIILSQIVQTPETYFSLGNYSGAHVYSFRVTVMDDHGAKVTRDAMEDFRFEKELHNNPPVAAIRLVPGNSGNLNTLFDFSVEASDPDKDALRYEWVFPDGKRYYSPTFRHRFTRPGDKKVILKVNDGVATIEKSVVISIFDKKKFEQKKNAKPRVALKGVLPKQFGDTNTIFRFYLKAYDPDGDRLEYLWDMGDGGKMFVKNPAYRFKKIGKYKVRVAVTDGHYKVIVPVDIVVRESDKDKKIKENAELTLKLEKEAKALGKVNIAGPGSKKKTAERINRLTAQAEKSAKIALQKQAAARELVEEELKIQEEKRNKLIEKLETQQSETARISLNKQKAALDKDIEILKKKQAQGGKNPYEEEIKLLEKQLAEIKAKIILKQKEFLKKQIIILKDEQAKETNRNKKFGYGLDIQKYQKYLQSSDLVSVFAAEYKEELLKQQSDLELSLENTDDSSTKVLLQTRISAIKKALMDLDDLIKVKLNLVKTQKQANEALDEGAFNQFIDKRIMELKKQKEAIELKLQSETDVVEIEVLKEELETINEELEKLGYSKGESVNIDYITIVSAKNKMEWKIGETEKLLATVVAPIDRKSINNDLSEYTEQLKVLKNLDVSGLAPELTIYELKGKLTQKKKDLIKVYKGLKGTALEKTRQKIILVEDSLKLIKDLPQFHISEDTTLENAERLLNNKRIKLTRTYVSLKKSKEKEDIFSQIEKINELYSFLEKFYNPKTKDQTLGSTKKELGKKISKLQIDYDNTDSLETQEEIDTILEKSRYDLVIIKQVVKVLQSVIKEKFHSEIANYRDSLVRDLAKIEDPEEKHKLEVQLAKIDSQNVSQFSLSDMSSFEGLMADFTITTGTQLSLYGQVPDNSHDRAVLFEWDLGNGKVVSGQNISVRYRDPGFYRISLKISDGLTESADSLTIKVEAR